MVYNVHKHDLHCHMAGEECGREIQTGGFVMLAALQELAADTNVIVYLMTAVGKNYQPDHTSQTGKSGGQYAEEYTQIDKTRQSEVRACMYDTRFGGKYQCICGKIHI